MTTRPRSPEFPGAFSYEFTGDRRWPDDPRKATTRRAAAAATLAPGAVATLRMSGYRVIVTGHRTRGLVDGTTCISRPRTEEQARSLIALIAGSTAAAGGGRPWRQLVAGGQRLIELERRL